MKVLVTGGLGYIGSHTVVELLESNNEVIIIDNLSNSSKDVINRIKKSTKKDITFYEGDVCALDLLEKIFNDNNIDAVMHFAGYKAVGESVQKPILYYENNLISTLHLCEKMLEHECYKFIFSSSATVYGSPKTLPITPPVILIVSTVVIVPLWSCPPYTLDIDPPLTLTVTFP